MLHHQNKLISSIVKKKLYEEVDEILTISRQGFDVFVRTSFPEIKSHLLELLKQELKINSREFKIIDSEKKTQQNKNSSLESHEEEDFMPTLLIGEFKPVSSYGFIPYEVRTPDQLIGNVASAVEIILLHYKLDCFIDSFDAKKLSRLKQIARVQGLKALIDAVIFIAYYGGSVGDNHRVQNYLDNIEFLKDSGKIDDGISLESCARKFLGHALTHGKDSHNFIKGCLSYFAVTKQGHTLTRVSEILNISRTTLQEHLRKAEELGVPSFLDGANSKSRS